MSSYNYSRNNSFKRGKTSHNRNSRQPKKDYIHPSKFISQAKPPSDEKYIPSNSFADLELNTLIKRNLTAMGFSDPSPIQDQMITPGLVGKDIVGIANTGTGKTAAFAIPLLNELINNKQSKAIILAPTRELAEQIDEQCAKIARGSGIRAVLLIGGTPMGPQLRSLSQRPNLVIGTPGRVKDHIERRTLRLDDCNIVVLDEVDRMLDMGFIDDIRSILSLTNTRKQSYYLSATLDDRVRSIINNFSRDPLYISVKSADTCENVEQNVISYNSSSDKINKLHDLLNTESVVKTLVFDDTHRSVEKLSDELIARGFSAGSIHGGKSQSQRQRILKQFKNDQINVLIATDVAARGLDVPDVTHVINYALPQKYDDYVHRIGRTGRAGKTGNALTFIEG